MYATRVTIWMNVKLTISKGSFTSLPKDRFPHSTAFQYFQQLDSLSRFVEFAKDQLCRPTDTSCSARLDSLSQASSLDISYDTAQHLLKVTALWPYQRQPLHATSNAQHRTEVGILSTDKPDTLEAHEIGMSGLLTVLGQDASPSPAMFSFAARHRDAEFSFSAQFLTPTGLHPTLQLRLASHTSPAADDETANPCTPYAYLTLPRTIFADKYQLSDPLFLASKNLTALRHITQPVDLEAPEYVMSQWGSAVLLQLSPPPPPSPPTGAKEGGFQKDEWTAEIPLHLRYLAPAQGGYAAVPVPYPAVFWACEPAPEQAVAFPSSPFEKGKVGYDGLFEEGTVFWHVEPKPVGSGGDDGSLVNVVRVPVLDLDRAGWVNAGTAAAVVVGFAWVVWKLVGVYARGEGGAVRVKEREGEKEKKRQ